MEVAELRSPVQALSATISDAASVSKEAATVGVGLCTGALLYRLVAREPKAPFWLRAAPLVLGVTVAGVRIVLERERRWARQASQNRAAIVALLRWLAVCEERVAIMKALSTPPAEARA